MAKPKHRRKDPPAAKAGRRTLDPRKKTNQAPKDSAKTPAKAGADKE